MSGDEPFDVSTFCKETYESARNVGYPFGRLLGLDDATIADAIQDAYVHVLSSMHELEARTPSHRVGNLCETVKFKILSANRKRCQQAAVSLDQLEDPQDPNPDDVDNVIARLASRSELRRVWAALDLLSHEHRELVALLITDALNDGDGSSRAERDRRIAAQLGKTEAAARAQRLRAVSALRRAIAQQSRSDDGRRS